MGLVPVYSATIYLLNYCIYKRFCALYWILAEYCYNYVYDYCISRCFWLSNEFYRLFVMRWQ